MKYSNPTPRQVLPGAVYEPDNSGTINLALGLAKQLKIGQVQKAQQQNQDRALELGNRLINGTPEEKQSAQLDIQAQNQVEQIQNGNREQQEILSQNAEKRRMLTEPESKKALLELNQLDSQMAAYGHCIRKR